MSVRRSTQGQMSTRMVIGSLVLALGIGAWGVTAGGAADPRAKFDRALSRLVPDEQGVRVIVTTARGRRGEVVRLLSQREHRLVADHPSIDAVTVELPAAALEELAADPAVARLSIDAPIQMLRGSFPR